MIWRPRWLSWPMIGWDFFQLLCNRWTKFNETWQEARSQHSLPSLCFWGHSESKDGTSSTKFVIFRLIIIITRQIIRYRASASLWRPLYTASDEGGGAIKQTGTSYNFDKVWSSVPEGCVGKLFSMSSIHNYGTQVHQCGLLFFCNFVEHLQQTCSLLCEGEFPLEYVSQTCGLVGDSLQLALKRPWCCKTQERCLWGTASHIPLIFSWALDCL